MLTSPNDTEQTYQVMISIRLPSVTLEEKTTLERAMLDLIAPYRDATVNTAMGPKRPER